VRTEDGVAPRLLVGNKNYSSWSLRPWLLMRQAGIDFVEEKIGFNDPQFKARVQRWSPAGRVPVLVDHDRGDLVVWDSLAIAEYLAERDPDRGLWPADPAARATARAVCAEMHSGFTNLRSMMAMNVSARLPGFGWNLAVQADIDRISAIWTGLRGASAGRGPFLFGRFSAADAYFAPVVFRFNTYQPALAAPVAEYMATMLALPAMREWAEAAAQENDFVADDEPYRRAP
jgi:glutathione S-transferase